MGLESTTLGGNHPRSLRNALADRNVCAVFSNPLRRSGRSRPVRDLGHSGVVGGAPKAAGLESRSLGRSSQVAREALALGLSVGPKHPGTAANLSGPFHPQPQISY
jgi:hypothetical protein